MRFIPRTAVAIVMLVVALPALAARALIDYDAGSPRIEFAVGDLETALRHRRFPTERHDSRLGAPAPGHEVLVRIAVVDGGDHSAPATIGPEGFLIRSSLMNGRRELSVTAIDSAGAMYGTLELAEQILTGDVDQVADTARNPHFAQRGTKFNIPLDLRTPSYSDMSDSAQHNIDTVWDFEFWRAYLDGLARDRYNMVSLWNLHPFPSMVKVPEYPKIALDDVWRSTIAFQENYSTRTTGLVTPAMLATHDVVRHLTIAQKIDFWRRVMEHARDRNISFYVFTWNIYTYGVQGQYGITDDLGNPKTVDYFRASVREMFHTYPLLAGIGLTVGENMGEISGADAFRRKEAWVFATYGQGVLDAARAEPQRRFRLIHRQHESRAQDIAATFAPLIAEPNVDFNFSFKYAQAHALSSTTQNFHRGYLEQLGNVKTFWTIRNDDALLLSWAAPDFVREFIGNIPRAPTQGFYFGSDMWVWGRTFFANPLTPRDEPFPLEIDNHWLHFLLWGRLGYDPSLDDERIAGLIGQRYPGVDGRRMLRVWQHASMIYPLVTGFHWADFDFQWYIEACRSRPDPAKTPTGFHSVDAFITQPVHPGTDNIRIATYAESTARGVMPRGTTPFQVADRIDAHADAALAALNSFGTVGQPRWRAIEFTRTHSDIYLMALLGKYYAAKIRGATELALYRATGLRAHQRLAVKQLNAAAEHASQYSRRISDLRARHVWTNRVGYVDFDVFARDAQHDVEIAEAALPAAGASR